jgi:hypothetical protein
MSARGLAAAMAAASMLVSAGGRASGAPVPSRSAEALSFWGAGAWHRFWESDRAPTRWGSEDSSLARALTWRGLAKGLEWTSLRLRCGAPVWRARLIVVRLDPRDLSLSLDMDLTRPDLHPAWSIDRAPEDAVLAVNAGQFTRSLPWGWVVIDGRPRLPAGFGPLSSTVSIDARGRVHWLHGGAPTAHVGIVTAFQSYPTLLSGDGVVPEALRASGSGVNLSHRDARLALGGTRDGRLLLVMTRFDAMGEMGQVIPLGPTTPEMAAIMGALGACDAVMLDGGISAQMLLRSAGSDPPLRWHGLRKVPLALLARVRGPSAGAALDGEGARASNAGPARPAPPPPRHPSSNVVTP